jgi:multisubunit Na+/H+ antiporter MnhG subunit
VGDPVHRDRITALYLLTFGLLLAILALVLFAAEENRPAILAICAGVFLAGGVGAGLWIKAKASAAVRSSRRPSRS